MCEYIDKQSVPSMPLLDYLVNQRWLNLGEALPGSLHHHRHHAVVLTELSLDTLLDQEFEGRHRAERVQNSEVPYIRCLIG